MALRFRVLGSGSSGNATLVEFGGTRLLIDAGLGPRILAERLQSAGVDPTSLATILLTHEHGDHARGAAAFSARWGVPLAGTRGTYAAAGFGAQEVAGYQVLEAGTTRRFGAVAVTAIRVPHDAVEPLAFVVAADGGGVLGHATDLGKLSRAVAESFARCDAVLVESNYDPGMLRNGSYPWSLKERILGPYGHLANADVGRYLAARLGPACRTVVLAHLSEQNNHPEVARMSAERALLGAGRRDVRVELTSREGTGWIDVIAAATPPARDAQLRLW